MRYELAKYLNKRSYRGRFLDYIGRIKIDEEEKSSLFWKQFWGIRNQNPILKPEEAH